MRHCLPWSDHPIFPHPPILKLLNLLADGMRELFDLFTVSVVSILWVVVDLKFILSVVDILKILDYLNLSIFVRAKSFSLYFCDCSDHLNQFMVS